VSLGKRIELRFTTQSTQNKSVSGLLLRLGYGKQDDMMNMAYSLVETTVLLLMDIALAVGAQLHSPRTAVSTKSPAFSVHLPRS